MALHSRKLLPTEKKYASSCYMCYVCPDDCYFPPPPPPPPPPSSSAASEKHQMSTILTFMLCVLGAAFLILSYLTIRRYRSRRRRPSAAPENGSSMTDGGEDHGDHHVWYIRTVGLSESVIDSIAVVGYKKGDGLLMDGGDCSVCLSEFEEDERVRLLPKCCHAFHVACIDTWLRSHQTCPVCRAPITIPDSNSNLNLNLNLNLSSTESNQSQSELEIDDDGVEEINQVRQNEIEKFRVLSDLADRRVDVDRDLQPVRRSVSMDFSSASSSSIEKQNSSIYKMIKSSSSMRRSFSFSGKRSLRKNNSRSQEESIPIQEVVITAQNRSRSMIME